MSPFEAHVNKIKMNIKTEAFESKNIKNKILK